ncbi:DUF4262 domain-containing protein [Ammonicoccus fulvus]|uniref:DUF4262 domain-containing protein n=1 Tax=Ammonicoccus fulvus TaxID=3138240 RepID=UPI003CC7CAFE
MQAIHGDGQGPPFCYTVGLFGLGHPELIVFGLDHESAGHTLNWFFDRIRRGEDLMPGQLVQAPRWPPLPGGDIPRPRRCAVRGQPPLSETARGLRPRISAHLGCGRCLPLGSGLSVSAHLAAAPGGLCRMSGASR